MASSGSELLAYILGGILYKKIGIRLAFCFSFMISVVGGVMILIWGENNPQIMPIFVTLAKFGISSGFVIVYVSTVDVFPTLFCATALGFCNFFARVATILAPLVAEK
jgi:MFS family permease